LSPFRIGYRLFENWKKTKDKKARPPKESKVPRRKSNQKVRKSKVRVKENILKISLK
jgi:hypothetical protein